jgi:hypothetical protein
MNNKITVGFPEQFPAPRGAEKIVCNTASEVDRMSNLMREQEKREQEMSDAEREAIEGPMRKYLREELQNRMANSTNALNREFCRMALEKIDAQERDRTKMNRESYMHAEGFEAGH